MALGAVFSPHRPHVSSYARLRMQTLVTGATGFVGAKLIPALQRAGHDVRAFARDPSRVQTRVPVVRGDAITGAGLEEAMAGVDVAYYLMHSMEAGAGNGFGDLERASVEHFVTAARPAGVTSGLLPWGPLLRAGIR